MFAIKLSMEKRIKIFWAPELSDLPAINATVFSTYTYTIHYDNIGYEVDLQKLKYNAQIIR